VTAWPPMTCWLACGSLAPPSPISRKGTSRSVRMPVVPSCPSGTKPSRTISPSTCMRTSIGSGNQVGCNTAKDGVGIGVRVGMASTGGGSVGQASPAGATGSCRGAWLPGTGCSAAASAHSSSGGRAKLVSATSVPSRRAMTAVSRFPLMRSCAPNLTQALPSGTRIGMPPRVQLCALS